MCTPLDPFDGWNQKALDMTLGSEKCLDGRCFCGTPVGAKAIQNHIDQMIIKIACLFIITNVQTKKKNEHLGKMR